MQNSSAKCEVLHGISNPAQVKELKKALSQKEQIHFLLIFQWTNRRECERGDCTSAEWRWIIRTDERLSESYERGGSVVHRGNPQ